jgi:hypothetical protein
MSASAHAGVPAYAGTTPNLAHTLFIDTETFGPFLMV